MDKNSRSVYGCRGSHLPKPENGRITRNDNAIYYHVTENSIGSIWLEGIKRDEVKGIRLLADGTEVKITSNWIVDNYPEAVLLDVSETVALPDPVDTVLKVIL